MSSRASGRVVKVWEVIFGSRYKKLLVENPAELGETSPRVLVLAVEQAKTGAFEVQSLFFGKSVVFGDFAIWRILGRFRVWLLGSGAKTMEVSHLRSQIKKDVIEILKPFQEKFQEE